MYYLVCAACLIALFAIEVSSDFSPILFLAELVTAYALLRYLYYALISAMFGKQDSIAGD